MRRQNDPAVVIGKKKWAFSDAQNGAVASANFYTVIETAGANGSNPRACLKHVFTATPRLLCVEDVQALLPRNVVRSMLDEMLRVPRFAEQMGGGSALTLREAHPNQISGTLHTLPTRR